MAFNAAEELPRRRLRVLVVDDAVDIRNLVASHLKRFGHEVLLASDGEEALVVAAEEKPDLAIVDIMMPGLNGYKVTERRRAATDPVRMPIIILTARAGGADRSHAFRVGADAYIQKPFELQRLTETIATVVAAGDRDPA